MSKRDQKMAAPLKYADYLTKEFLREKYNEFKSVDKLSNHLDIDKTTIINYMNRHRLKRIGAGKQEKPRKCVNDELFSTDTEISMYLAGFIAADGCLHKSKSKPNGIISIALGHKDIAYLKLIKKLFKSKHKLHKWYCKAKNSWGYGFQITSKKMFDDLMARFNITPKKSLTLKFPKRLIKHPLVHHFIRGFIDGDGSFWQDNRYNTLRLSLIGTQNMLKTIERVFATRCSIQSKHRIIRDKKYGKLLKTFGLRYGDQTELNRIIHWLYDGAIIFLKRKRDIAMTVNPPKHHGLGGRVVKLSNEDIIAIRVLGNQKPVKEIAKQFGVGERYIRRILAGKARAILE